VKTNKQKHNLINYLGGLKMHPPSILTKKLFWNTRKKIKSSIKLPWESKQLLHLFNSHFLVVHVLELTYLLKEIIGSFMAILHLRDPDDHCPQLRTVLHKRLKSVQLLFSIEWRAHSDQNLFQARDDES